MQQILALRDPRFRLLWINTICSSTARWAELVVVSWLTLELTDSPLKVGIVGGCKMAGYLAAPFMGVLADRMDRRRLLIVSASVNGVTALAMLLLLLSGWLAFGHIIVLSIVSSITWALDSPTRQAFVTDLVDRQNLSQAVALNSVASEITVVVGPALGGLLIPTLGTSGAYGVITCVYLLVAVLMFALKAKRRTAHAQAEPPLKSLVAGLHYVRNNKTVLMLLVIALLANLLASPYRHSYLPLFARYVLGVGAAGYGMLTSVAGLGALLAGISIVTMGGIKGKGRMVLTASLVWSVMLVLFALSKSYLLSLALIFIVGFMQAASMTLLATILMSNTDPDMRGRIMGLRHAVVIALPVGNFFAGAATDWFGAPASLGVSAACSFIIMAAIAFMVPELRRLD